MSRTIEQERALAYLRRKGTEAVGGALRKRVARTLARLERQLDAIDADTARARPDEATWCVQEVVHHLAASLEPGVEQLEALIEGRSAGDAIPASLLEADALDVSWLEAKSRLWAVHARFLKALDRAVAADPPLDRKAPVVMLVQVDDGSGGVSPLEWTEPLDWKSFALIPHVHTYEHIDQIERILARVQSV